jgi:glycosyltransferase involved in cell wall biosynthesis
MPPTPAKSCAFVYVGELDYRGRLRKEIRTLCRAGIRCRLLLGNITRTCTNQTDYDFPVTDFATPRYKSKTRFFLSLLPFAWNCGNRIARSNADVVFCVGIFAALAGVVVKWFKPSIHLVFDNNELYLESFRNPIKRMVWRPLQKLIVRSSDHIIHAEPNRMEYFQKVHGGNDKPHSVIENFPNYYPPIARNPVKEHPIPVVYLGVLGDDRYTEELIETARTMEGEITLDLVGFGTPAALKKVHDLYRSDPPSNLRILPAVPYDQISELLKNYLIGIAFYKNTNLNNYFCAPNKVYDYLMSGMTVIANDYPGLRSVLEVQKLGACVSEVTPKDMQHAISRILSENRWTNITDEVRHQYSWEAQESKLLEICNPSSPRNKPAPTNALASATKPATG